MFAHRRTGERVENAVTEDVRGGAEKCMNAVKYNKMGEGTRNVVAAVRCVGVSWERGDGRGNNVFVGFRGWRWRVLITAHTTT